MYVIIYVRKEFKNPVHTLQSLHDVDTELIESKESPTEPPQFEANEDDVADLANVAVAAIQSLATVPPSTEGKIFFYTI